MLGPNLLHPHIKKPKLANMSEFIAHIKETKKTVYLTQNFKAGFLKFSKPKLQLF